MVFVLAALSLIVFFAGFTQQGSVILTNPFLGFVFFLLNLLVSHLIVAAVGFGLVFFFVFRQGRRRRRGDSYTHISTAFFSTCMLFLTSSIFAFAALLVTAVVQLNVYSIMLRVNPAILGVTTDTKRIATKLKENGTHPAVVASDNTSQNNVIAVAQATLAPKTLYEATILASIPQYLILPTAKQQSSFMLIDNTLIIAKIEKKDLQTLGPLLGYLFVQDYFPDRQIKSLPTVSLMDEHEYEVFRKADAKEKLAKATTEVQKMTDAVSSVSAQIAQDKLALANNQTTQQQSLKEQSTQYNQCLSTGTYHSGTFVPQYSKDYCQQYLKRWDTTITDQQNEEKKLNEQQQNDQQLLKEYQYYVTFFKAQQSLLSLSSTNIPSELGIFQQPNTIRIILQQTSPHHIGDFLETLCHEYLHYASYVPGKRFDSSFFEEALTEYFARRVVKDSLQIDTDLGYPAGVKIIEALTQRIAEVDLADIYFSKDQAGLEKTINLAYGDNFYANNITLFESLQYTSDPKQELQLANNIMKKIGGKPLQQSDLYSKESNL